MLPKLWTLLHLLTAFSFVGTLLISEWNGRAARATNDWGQRAILFGVVLKAGRMAGLVPLFLTGILGNLAAVGLAYRMSTDRWLQLANGLWLAAMLVLWLVVLQSARTLVTASEAARAGGTPTGYDSALARWRVGNMVLSLLYLALLVTMVFATRS